MSTSVMLSERFGWPAFRLCEDFSFDEFKPCICDTLRVPSICDPDVRMVVGNFDQVFMKCKVQLWTTS